MEPVIVIDAKQKTSHLTPELAKQALELTPVRGLDTVWAMWVYQIQAYEESAQHFMALDTSKSLTAEWPITEPLTALGVRIRLLREVPSNEVWLGRFHRIRQRDLEDIQKEFHGKNPKDLDVREQLKKRMQAIDSQFTPYVKIVNLAPIPGFDRPVV